VRLPLRNHLRFACHSIVIYASHVIQLSFNSLETMNDGEAE
jgi:hypothetical protein